MSSTPRAAVKLGAVFIVAAAATAALCPKKKVHDAAHEQVVCLPNLLIGVESLHDVPFTNDSSRTLVVSEIKSSCACTITPNPPAAIPPRSTVAVPVRMTASHVDLETVARITVLSSGGEPERLRLIAPTLPPFPGWPAAA